MPPKSRPDESPWRTSWLLKSGLLLGVIVLFLGGVIWAGRWAKEHIRAGKQLTMAFEDIECDPPVAMDRHKFLDEVRYYASPRLPEMLDLVDDDIAARLSDGFARHPWVEKVDDVAVKPPRQVTVKLTIRTPVLAVKVGNEMLAVDGSGIALPKDAPTAGLPVYEGEAKAPREIGQRWGDPNVEAAARQRRK